MRLLPVRDDHGGVGAARREAEADRQGYRRGDHQHLPVRDLPASARGDPRRGERVREGIMNFVPRINNRITRRPFLAASAPAGGGLALGLKFPFGLDVVRAADGSPEVNAWVVIRPDETV